MAKEDVLDNAISEYLYSHETVKNYSRLNNFRPNKEQKAGIFR
jgi:hypothetical protein